MNCDWIRNADATITCRQCRFSRGWTRADTLPKTMCGVHGPSLPRAAFNFASALVSHVANGFQQRNKPEIETLLQICQACPLYDGAKCTHQDCGCAISGEKRFFSKLAWRSEACPDGRWS